jgi:hypothetical protein
VYDSVKDERSACDESRYGTSYCSNTEVVSDSLKINFNASKINSNEISKYVGLVS